MASSDVEFSSPPRPTWETSNVGKASLDKIINDAVNDRYSSKKASKQLQDCDGRPETLRYRYLWGWQRFETFRKVTLQADLTVAPTGEQFERFFAVIIPKVVPLNPTGVPSYKTVKSGLQHLIRWAQFNFPKFKLTTHEGTRIKSLLKNFLRNGQLTNESVREKQWVGCVLIRAMTTSALKDAMSNGTANWDITISSVLNVLLLSSLAARSGDLTSSAMRRHSPTAFLNYNDIVLRLVDGKEIVNLVANVTIRNEKGYKENQSVNRIVRLNALKDSENNIVCPIRFILILALRLGNVSGSTISEVLSTAYRRSDKTVKWTHGERPVMVAHVPKGPGTQVSMLQPEKPISQASLRKYIQRVGRLVGLLAPIVPHDLRRGSGQDISILDRSALPVGNTDIATASALGHSYKSVFQGITESYKGATNVDYWTKRVENAKPDPMGLQTAAEPYKKLVWTGEALDEICKEHGVDKSDRRARKLICGKVCKKLEAAHYRAWTEKMKAAPSPTILKPSVGTKRTHDHISSDVLSESTNARIDLSNTIPTTLTSNLQPVEDDEYDGGQDIVIDPALLALEDTMSGVNDQGLTDKMQDDLTDHLLSHEESSTPTVFTLPPLEFVQHFSSINEVHAPLIYRRPTTPAVWAETLKALAGNSRNPPTAFLFKCENKSLNGCTYTSPEATIMTIHKAVCKRQKEVESKRNYQCPQCPTRLATPQGLHNHIQAQHTAFKPRTCRKDYPGCDPNKVFQSHRELGRHKAKYHSKQRTAWVPMRCPVTGCDNSTCYTSYGGMSHHISSAHNQISKPASFYINQQQKGQ